MIDIQTVNDVYKCLEVCDDAIVEFEFIISDAFSKPKSNSIFVKRVLNRRIGHPIDQWIAWPRIQDQF